jgi:hypothetical protein
MAQSIEYNRPVEDAKLERKVLRFRTTTGAENIAASVDLGKTVYIEEIRVHYSGVPGAGNLTVNINNDNTATYDQKIVDVDNAAVTDYLYQPTKPILMEADEQLDFAQSVTNSVTCGVTITVRV